MIMEDGRVMHGWNSIIIRPDASAVNSIVSIPYLSVLGCFNILCSHG